ncbi:MAG: DUF438 domain-containing protein [Candidatus ainarchaeum sp.]|nr:DUF438 domain-containing protein [Candidatus ainarchaeum sp.]
MTVEKKYLDLRKISPFERHTKLFLLWESLSPEEILVITNDHAPTPLYYQFEAEQKGLFEWNYVKEGPTEWIFELKKISKSSNKEKVKTMLKELKLGSDTKKIKERGKDLLRNISAEDLAIIEQEMIQEGLSRKDLRKLCDVHLEVMAENLDNKELNLLIGHPIHTLMQEHQMILEYAKKLKIIECKLKKFDNYKSAEKEINELVHLAKNLVEANKHHEREEKVLFPTLEKYGVSEPPMIMLEEHHEIVPKKEELYAIAKNHANLDYSQFVKQVSDLINFIAKELPSHIHKEDKILYPMAIDTIPAERWDGMKKECDKIGYCNFTLEK